MSNDNLDVSFLADLLKEASEEVFNDSLMIDWASLQQSAINFVHGYEILQRNELLQKKQLRQLLISQDPNSSVNFLYNFQKQHKEAYFTRAKYLLAFNFDNQLTKYLGQVPKEAVYVIWDSKNQQLKSFKVSMASLAKLASKEGRLNLNITALKAEGAKQLEKNDDIADINKDHLIEAQAAYRGTVARLNQYYNKIGAQWTKRKNGLLMWKESGAWVVANVNSYGDIKEGYIAALMTKHKSNLDVLNQSLGTERFYADSLISAFYTNFITGVTNKAAIREEDVVTENGQYAVKSSGASMPSFSQYLNVANMIINQASPLKPDLLSKEIEKLYPMDEARNKIIGTFNTSTQLTTTELLSKLQKDGLHLTYNILS